MKFLHLMKVSNLVVFELMESCDFQIFYCLYQSIKQEKRLFFCEFTFRYFRTRKSWLEASFLTCTFFYLFCNHIGTKKHFHFTMGNTLLKHLKHNNSFLGASSRFCKCWSIFVALALEQVNLNACKIQFFKTWWLSEMFWAWRSASKFEFVSL